jgi:hypothetical protein
VIVVCCQVEFSAWASSLILGSPTDFGVSSEGDREAPPEKAMTRNRVEAPQKKKCILSLYFDASGTVNMATII